MREPTPDVQPLAAGKSATALSFSDMTEVAEKVLEPRTKSTSFTPILSKGDGGDQRDAGRPSIMNTLATDTSMGDIPQLNGDGKKLLDPKPQNQIYFDLTRDLETKPIKILPDEPDRDHSLLTVYFNITSCCSVAVASMYLLDIFFMIYIYKTDIVLQTKHAAILGPEFNASNVILNHKKSIF